MSAALNTLGLTKLKRNAKTTLLVCPLTTIFNWEEQIKQHIQPGKFSYYVYHGATRIRDVEQLAQYDLVITTYGSISTELGLRNKRKPGKYPMEEIGWFRIVLDEAHMIRETSTQQFKAIVRLQANRRWAVTGTPVQNRLEDLAALLAFLRLKPIPARKKQPGEEPRSRVSKLYPLELVIYGPKKWAKPVADHFKKNSMVLRHPNRVDKGIKYVNYQVVTTEPAAPRPQANGRTLPNNFVPGMAIAQRTVEEMRSDVMGVFDQMGKNNDVPELEPSDLIVTPLLKHQKQGLYFMTNKEADATWEQRTTDSFYKARISSTGQRVFLNVVTGLNERQLPPQTRGGILADMMGLGKTLTELADKLTQAHTKILVAVLVGIEYAAALLVSKAVLEAAQDLRVGEVALSKPGLRDHAESLAHHAEELGTIGNDNDGFLYSGSGHIGGAIEQLGGIELASA
ncbi:hypothetical protein BN1723_016021, partial [Verticillium longisporum]